MNSADRFTPDCEPCNEFESWVGVMRDDPNGFYVRYTDYEQRDSDALVFESRWLRAEQKLAAAREALQAAEADAGRVFERAYASGYRSALQAAASECRRQGEALDFSGNPYVRYADAIKCSAAIENMNVPAIATLQRDRQP